MQNASADAMIKRLKKWFARFGISKYIVSNNRPQFLSGEFRRYCDLNNIRHISSAPYLLKTNGLVESTVRTLKGRYYATRDSISDLEEVMTQVLTTYRLGERSSTGRSPAKIMLGRLRPNAEHEIVKANYRQSHLHNLHSKEREFEISQPVWLNNENTNGWRERERNTLRRHADQLKNRLVIPNHESSSEVTETVVPVNEANTNTTLRCSSRNRKPTKRYDYDDL
ncbi:uncharacterized protein LOC135930928 [Gordionus sp. m RMFG-2023]|uniref:uncharacterized protein LOC135930928 n=1 Tax=Gordionus sp. m RMFG-2023 TaxID=3053472 RepID=UPI0031FD5C02